MSIQRLLFIPEMKWFGRFLVGVAIFSWAWLKSRRFARIAWAAPAMILTVAFVWSAGVSWLRSRDPALLDQYLILARQAVADGHVADARLLFRRAQILAPGDNGISAELATSLFDLGERSEAYQLLSSIAPVQKSGYLPAHRFLVQNPPELPPAQQDYFRAIHLSHLVRNTAETRAERVQLLHILAQYRKFDDVERLIRDALDRYPEDRLFLAQLKFRNGDQSGARRETEEACRAFSVLIEQDPGNADRRIHLAQGYVFLTKFADAICVISEGMSRSQARESHAPATHQTSIDAPTAENDTNTEIESEQSLHASVRERHRKLAEVLCNIYFAWMSTLPADDQTMQFRCLQRMLNQNTVATSAAAKGLASASEFSIGAPAEMLTRLQTALADPENSWTIAAIEGNARVARGEWPIAEEAYRTALKSVPDEPTLANNLAWLLLRKSRAITEEAAEEVRQQTMVEALQWSEIAVEQMPEIVSFLETRGQIQAGLGNHALALKDLNECLERGKDSPEIRRTIEAATQTLR
jgi:tetratricopeptide (TPR) repeat protein